MSATRHDLPVHECIALLDADSVGRLCIIDHGYPLAFPVNYRLVRHRGGDRLVFRTSSDAAMARYAGPASFEVDQISADRRRAWSVIVRGDLRRAHGEADLPDPEPLVSERRHQWLVLDVAAWSGRRFTGVDRDDRFTVDWQTVDA